MFVLANGAFKSGSTWLRDIIQHMMPFEPIPDQWAHTRNAHNINAAHLEGFLEKADLANQNYLSKGHIFDPKKVRLLKGAANVYVLDITRDIKDSIVSHYFHLIREKRIREGFLPYYWRIGRYKAHEIRLYHQVWRDSPGNVYSSSFERLKEDFDCEIQRIGAFLGLELSPEDIARIREETSIQRMREKRGETEKPEHKRFIRKGKIGEWREHFDDLALEDIERIEAHGLNVVGRIRYAAMFTLRRRLRQSSLFGSAEATL